MVKVHLFFFIPQGHTLVLLSLWFCDGGGPWARDVLYRPELLYSTPLSLHRHHTNKNPP